MPIIETKNLTYTYGEDTPQVHTAINDISVSIDDGEFVGIIGHTGSGKSTFVQHLNGLLKPTSGQVFVNGRDIWENEKKLREVRFQVGLVFQYPEYQLFEETARKDISFGPRNMGLSEEEIAERVEEAARFVDLKAELLDKSPFDLSGGEKRRVAIAGIVAMRPRVLILDEPCAGLDPQGRDRILGEIREYHEQTKSCVMIVSHSMEDVAKYASKVLVINQSRLFAYDDKDAVFSRAAELSSMGLALPSITRIFLSLRQRGYDLPQNIYTPQQGAEAIRGYLEKGGGCIDAID